MLFQGAYPRLVRGRIIRDCQAARPVAWPSTSQPDSGHGCSPDPLCAQRGRDGRLPGGGYGPFDVVLTPGTVSHVELYWDIPGVAALQGIADMRALIFFDKRGTGLSDRVTGAPTLEERSDDIRAVMDAAGSGRAALFGASEGVPMSVVFAASYPERVSALVLYGGKARERWAPDYLLGSTEREERQKIEDGLEMFVTSEGTRKWCVPVCRRRVKRRCAMGPDVSLRRQSRVD